MYRIYENHNNRLPYVRIKRIELSNFKGVRHGIIDFNCAKEYVPYNTKSDILGLYGQNGSGKSSLVEAIDLVKGIVSGAKITPYYTRFIDVLTGYAVINIEFDFQYKNGDIVSVSYEAKLEVKEKSVKSIDDESSFAVDKKDDTEKRYLTISDETIKTNLYADGSIARVHTIIDTKKNLLCPDSLAGYYYDKTDANILDELGYLKRSLYEDSQSFVFNHAVSESLNLVNTENNSSRYYEILAELNLFASFYLYVTGSRAPGSVSYRTGVPVYVTEQYKPFMLGAKDNIIPDKFFHSIERTINMLNIVLDSLIPDLRLKIDATPTKDKKGRDAKYVQIMAVRGEREIPLDYESDGIIKLVTMLGAFILAFNQGSTTLVVDEFDSGVFEYLLGELLEIFESSGKGQLIFTSHNLRPLEVLNKKFIRFTTTDAENRYYKLKNVGNSNNLRDLYLREVQFGDQDVELYKKTKNIRITQALIKADKEE